ncbi:UDP-glycosyltransferase 91C1-like [Cryptomeria japonica]|uniref:UDP-glycosyltransferase 91C1-like n=1 Tax=Cryptomeria japonica TaxID=3369 RepID=UPI0027DA191A|nr:UDP-glycosyltransferase 91C1-like [Cryptomeria japonica]
MRPLPACGKMRALEQGMDIHHRDDVAATAMVDSTLIVFGRKENMRFGAAIIFSQPVEARWVKLLGVTVDLRFICTIKPSHLKVFKRAIKRIGLQMESRQSSFISMEEEMQPLHVMLVPWLSYSHIAAFLELAKKLGTHGLRVSFLSSPLNIRWIRQHHLIPEIELLEIPLLSMDGLPEGVESTADLKRGDTFDLLMEAMDGWEKPFEDLLGRISPDFVIHDMTQYWAFRIADKLGIPTIFFANTSATGVGYLVGHEASIAEIGDLTVPPPSFPSPNIRLSPFLVSKFLKEIQKREEHINLGERFGMCMKNSWVIVLNTCVEMEREYVDYLQTVIARPVLPVGILLPDLPPRPAVDRCLAWLDLQHPHSVVFVSFASEFILSNQELAALALGLEESEVPFLCVLLRQMAAALPQGFVERTQGRGLLVTEWVPQLHILSHSAVGAFLTHCGWNSVTEGLRFGVPLVTFPLQHEQSLNAKLIAQELKLGVEVRRNDEDDSFSKQDVSKAVCTLMVEEEGRYIRSHVQEIGGVLTKNNRQIQGSNIHHFISLMKKEKAACKAAKQAMLDSDASGQLETELAISGMQLEFLERDSKLIYRSVEIENNVYETLGVQFKDEEKKEPVITSNKEVIG